MNPIKKVTLLSLITTVLAACGGGSSSTAGDHGEVEYSDMGLVSILPADLSSGVDRDTEISAQFSADLLPTSANSNGFRLRRDDEFVSGTVSMLGTDTIRFTPDKTLDLLTLYHPGVTSDIADIDGRPFGFLGDGEWAFLTRDGVWGETKKVAEGAIENPQLIDEGDAMSSFYQSDNLSSGQNDLFYTRQPLDDGSVQTRKVVSNGENDGNVTGSLNAIRLGNGDLLAVWQELSGDGKDEIWYNRYAAAAESWGTSARVTLPNENKLRPRLVSNASDSVFLLFDLEDSISMATDLIVIGYSVADDQWLGEALIADDLDVSTGSAQASIAMDSAGNMMAIWFSNNLRFRSRFYNATSGLWEDTTVFIQPDAGDTYLGSQIVVDSQNNFTAAWSQKNALSGLPYIWTSRYSSSEGWSEAHQIIGSTMGTSPIMQVNKDNNIILLSLQEVGSGDDNLLFSGFKLTDNQWTNAAPLEDSEQPASQPSLVVDRSGNFMAMWNQKRSGTFIDLQGNISLDPSTIWARRFDNNTAESEWLPAIPISPIAGAVDKPVMAINSSGEIMALWMQIIDTTPTLQGRYFE